MQKFEVGNATKDYSQKKNKQNKLHLYNLYKLLGEMQDEIVDTTEQEELHGNMEKVRAEISSIEEIKTKSAIVRC